MSVPTNIFGAYKYSDLASIPVSDVTEDRVVESITSFLDGENIFVAEMLGLLSNRGTDVQTKFASSGGGLFQRIGAATGLEATRTSGNWTVGFPINAYADRSLFSKAYLSRATLADINRDTLDKTLKDITTQIDAVNRAILTGTNYTFNDDEWPGRKAGSVGVKALANNDSDTGQVYVPGTGAVTIGSLNHYITSGSGTLAEAAFTAARSLLRNVGNDDDIVYLVSKTTADSAEGLTNFIKDADPNVSNANAITAKVASPRARGRIADGEVIAWPHFPDGYIFAFDRSKEKPVRFRESDLADERGLKLVQDDELTEIPLRPLLNKTFRRIFGVGIYNRTNGAVVQVSSNGSYTAPSTFA